MNREKPEALHPAVASDDGVSVTIIVSMADAAKFYSSAANITQAMREHLGLGNGEQQPFVITCQVTERATGRYEKLNLSSSDSEPQAELTLGEHPR